VVDDGPPRPSIEAREGLVEDEVGGFHRERARDGDALALAAGQFADPLVAAAAHVHRLQRPVDA
jgi:hypothetical protein